MSQWKWECLDSRTSTWPNTSISTLEWSSPSTKNPSWCMLASARHAHFWSVYKRQLSLGCSCHDLWNPFRYCRHGSPNFRQQQADYSCSSKYRAQCMQLPTIKYTSRLVPFYWITWYCMSQWHGTRMNHCNLFDLSQKVKKSKYISDARGARVDVDISYIFVRTFDIHAWESSLCLRPRSNLWNCFWIEVPPPTQEMTVDG
jgi:hypothetical protein